MSATTLTAPRTPARQATRPRLATYLGLELRRQLRDRMGMFFVVALPAFLYVIFGVGVEDPYGSGNVAFYVMAGMAAYGAVSATTAISSGAATEQQSGWGRQLALTPASTLHLVATKAAVAMLVAAVPVTLIFGIGAVTGARGTASDWLLTAVIIWVGSLIFALYGLAVCLHFRGTNAASIASGLIVIMAFLGNLFTPMNGLLLDLGRLTPLYGYAGLARYPLTGGTLPMSDGHNDLLALIANVVAWTVIFAALAMWGLRRRRARV